MSVSALKSPSSEYINISLANIQSLNEFASCHKFKKDQVIFYSGHMPYGLFILTNGEVEIQYRNGLRAGKKEMICGTALLGINAFKNQKPFLTTVKAINTCDVYFLSASAYKELKKENNTLYRWIQKYL